MAKKAKKRGAKAKTQMAPVAKTQACCTQSARLMAEMESYYQHLVGEQVSIQQQMDAVKSAIESLGGVAKARKPQFAMPTSQPVVARRGPRPEGTSLKDFITKVLAAAPDAVSVKDLTNNVLRAGYQTKSSNLGNQISMALMQMTRSKQVKKVARGLYTV